MRKTMMQAVFVCVVLAVTRDVANAIFYITIPNNEVEVTDVITQASYGWSTTERLNVGSGNAFNGPGTWDGVLTVHSNGTVTVGTIFMINGGPKTNGKIIVDGTNSTMTANGILHLAMNSAPGIYRILFHSTFSLEEPCLIEITPDAGFAGALGVPYDLITATVAVNADPNNLVLDLSALDGSSAAAGFLALNGGGTALQLTLTSTGQGESGLTRVDNVNVTFFDFDSAPGFEYGLESSTNMADWVFTGLIVTGDGGTMSVFDPTGTDTNKSYRLSITGL